MKQKVKRSAVTAAEHPDSSTTESAVFGALEIHRPEVDPLDDFARTQDGTTIDRDAEHAAVHRPTLIASGAHAQRATQIASAFISSAPDDEVGERLLEELIAREVPAALELQDVEFALVGLLGKTLTDPALALKLLEMLKEVGAVSGAMRRRMEGCLSAVANLRAQRRFLGGHR